MESNDSPEIPERRETSDIPGLPSGVKSCQHWMTKQVTFSLDANIEEQVRNLGLSSNVNIDKKKLLLDAVMTP